MRVNHQKYKNSMDLLLELVLKGAFNQEYYNLQTFLWKICF